MGWGWSACEGGAFHQSCPVNAAERRARPRTISSGADSLGPLRRLPVTHHEAPRKQEMPPAHRQLAPPGLPRSTTSASAVDKVDMSTIRNNSIHTKKAKATFTPSHDNSAAPTTHKQGTQTAAPRHVVDSFVRRACIFFCFCFTAPEKRHCCVVCTGEEDEEEEVGGGKEEKKSSSAADKLSRSLNAAVLHSVLKNVIGRQIFFSLEKKITIRGSSTFRHRPAHHARRSATQNEFGQLEPPYATRPEIACSARGGRGARAGRQTKCSHNLSKRLKLLTLSVDSE